MNSCGEYLFVQVDSNGGSKMEPRGTRASEIGRDEFDVILASQTNQEDELSRCVKCVLGDWDPRQIPRQESPQGPLWFPPKPKSISQTSSISLPSRMTNPNEDIQKKSSLTSLELKPNTEQNHDKCNASVSNQRSETKAPQSKTLPKSVKEKKPIGGLSTGKAVKEINISLTTLLSPPQSPAEAETSKLPLATEVRKMCSVSQSLLELLGDADGEVIEMTLSVFTNVLQDKDILVSSTTAPKLAKALLELLDNDNSHVQLLSLDLFCKVMKLVVDEGKKSLKTTVCQSLPPLLFHCHDENQRVAEASRKTLRISTEFLKKKTLTQLVRTEKLWMFAECLLAEDRSRVAEHLRQALPYLQSPQEPLQVAAIMFIGDGVDRAQRDFTAVASRGQHLAADPIGLSCLVAMARAGWHGPGRKVPLDSH
ncbi:hypothetical protein TURU_060722 [Turdus rufiventris]|nr:hypothetical protein TURU_060722 [Turdus rufiventris]